jgi:acyl-CoA reductase-like NAD-dependent aldehyde dehydrogenase
MSRRRKPSRSAPLANYRIMQVLQEAGLPEGVIKFVPFDRQYSDVVLEHPALAGVQFIGS